jgi:hypothetical protein
MARPSRYGKPYLSLDRALSDREWDIRKAAQAAAYGETRSYSEPREPNNVEEAYLRAIEAFRRRSPTAGYDWIDKGDFRALRRLGKSRRRGR